MAAAQNASSTTQGTHTGTAEFSTVQPQAQAATPAKLILKEGTDVKLKFAQRLELKDCYR
jgi:hypothetical protein